VLRRLDRGYDVTGVDIEPNPWSERVDKHTVEIDLREGSLIGRSDRVVVHRTGRDRSPVDGRRRGRGSRFHVRQRLPRRHRLGYRGSSESARFVADTTKARRILDFEAEYDLRTGIEATIEWYEDRELYHEILQ